MKGCLSFGLFLFLAGQKYFMAFQKVVSLENVFTIHGATIMIELNK
jgi:hypothetical protein